MKHILLVICIAFIASINGYAQLRGQFYTAQDGHVYFQAHNVTGYNYQVSIVASSSDRTNSEVINVGSGFYLGPTTPWKWFWKKGDTITVTYPNGQSVYWICPFTDSSYGNVNFKGKHCTHTQGCDCSGFSPITNGEEWEKSYCKRCGHHKKYHK